MIKSRELRVTASLNLRFFKKLSLASMLFQLTTLKAKARSKADAGDLSMVARSATGLILLMGSTPSIFIPYPLFPASILIVFKPSTSKNSSAPVILLKLKSLGGEKPDLNLPSFIVIWQDPIGQEAFMLKLEKFLNFKSMSLSYMLLRTDETSRLSMPLVRSAMSFPNGMTSMCPSSSHSCLPKECSTLRGRPAMLKIK
jgi:hypothetical protein